MSSYFVFNFGYQYAKLNIAEQIEKCATLTVKNAGHMSKYYGHDFKGKKETIWNHADALTNSQWAKCFREEFNRR